MFRNYFKTAWRNLQHNKTFSLINIIGLAVGLACALIILFHVKEELSYDKGFSRADNIFRISLETGGEKSRKWAATSPVAGTEMKQSFPEIDQVIRFHRLYPYQLLSTTDENNVTKRFEEQGGLFADTAAASVFDLQFIHGDRSTALSEPNAIILTSAMAKKYFGNDNVIGKTLNEDIGKFPLKITGVVKGFSFPTHLKFDYLVSMATVSHYLDQRSMENHGWSGFYNYVTLKPGASKENLNKKLHAFTVKFENPDGESAEREPADLSFKLQPITEIHLHSKLEKELSANSDITYVYIFSVAALFILLVAAVNFINISTTLAFNRMKEIGMRKVVGASKNELVAQFLGESFLVTVLAAALAILLFKLAMPFYEQITNNHFTTGQLLTPSNLLLFLLLIVLISFLAGIYPAWFVARFSPITSLKGKKATGSSVHVLRKALTIFQFVVSIFMIFGTIVIYKQMKLFHNRDLGFDKEQMLAITMYSELWKAYPALADKLRQDPSVASYAATSTLPGERFGFYSFEPLSAPNVKDMPGNTRVMWADDNIINTLHITLKEGRNFYNQVPDIKKKEFILNESAVKAFYFKDPLGKRVVLEQDTGEIVGVIKDFNFASLHTQVEPLVIQYNPFRANYLLVKVKPNQIPQALKTIGNNIGALAPSSKFTYTFLDDKLNQLYNAENRMSSVFKIFAAFAIVISCLGLFGLSAYAARLRTKEIGIRKVLGASESGLVFLLSKDFMRLVLIAVIIALPVSWVVMNNWLGNFAYHIDIDLSIFLGSGIAAIIVAMTTVSVEAVKTAILNPVNSLKTD